MATRSSTFTRTDEKTRKDVIAELEWDPKVTSLDIGVAVKDGVVTLSGYVSSYFEKDAAEKAAKRVYGVRAVANDLEVKLPSERTMRRSRETPFRLCNVTSWSRPTGSRSL